MVDMHPSAIVSLKTQIGTIKKAYEIIYQSGLNLSKAEKRLTEEFSDNPHVRSIIELLNKCNRGII